MASFPHDSLPSEREVIVVNVVVVVFSVLVHVFCSSGVSYVDECTIRCEHPRMEKGTKKQVTVMATRSRYRWPRVWATTYFMVLKRSMTGKSCAGDESWKVEEVGLRYTVVPLTTDDGNHRSILYAVHNRNGSCSHRLDS